MWLFHIKFPSRLYDWHAGWLLDSKFCRLTHVGRKSGRRYRTVLEVAGTSAARDELFVMSGLGSKANWYQNLHANGAAEIEVGRRHFLARFRDLKADEAVEILAHLERRYRLIRPIFRHILSKLAGFRYDGTEAARQRLVSALPMVAFSPALPQSGR